jgi:quercetin dioxygenase-like cupin family protein
MRRSVSAFILAALVVPAIALSQTQTPTQPIPLGAGRPETPGITRTQLKDDEKSTVTRVHLIPGAAEPVHTHATDLILIPVTDGTVEWIVAGRKVTSFKPGEVQFVPKLTEHQLKNTGTKDFEAIAVAIK